MNANKPVTKTLIMKHIGMDDFSCPVYQDQFGHLWKDIDLGEQDTPCLYSVTNNDLDGEPLYPIRQEHSFDPAPFRRNRYEFEYRMLSKLQSDCEYFLGYGNRNPKILCDDNVQSHITRMQEFWKGFPEGEKPEWLTWEQILEYQKAMLA